MDQSTHHPEGQKVLSVTRTTWYFLETDWRESMLEGHEEEFGWKTAMVNDMGGVLWRTYTVRGVIWCREGSRCSLLDAEPEEQKHILHIAGICWQVAESSTHWLQTQHFRC